MYCTVNTGPGKLEGKMDPIFRLQKSCIMLSSVINFRNTNTVDQDGYCSCESHGSMDRLAGQQRLPDPLAIGDEANQQDLQNTTNWWK